MTKPFAFILNEDIICTEDDESVVMDIYYNLIQSMDEDEYLEVYAYDYGRKCYDAEAFAEYGTRPKKDAVWNGKRWLYHDNYAKRVMEMLNT